MQSKNLSTFPLTENKKAYEVRFDVFCPETGKAFLRISKVPEGMAHGKGLSFDINGGDIETVLNVFKGSDAGDIMTEGVVANRWDVAADTSPGPVQDAGDIIKAQIAAGVNAVLASMGMAAPAPEPEPEPFKALAPVDAIAEACRAAGVKPKDLKGMHAATRGTILQHAYQLQGIF